MAGQPANAGKPGNPWPRAWAVARRPSVRLAIGLCLLAALFFFCRGHLGDLRRLADADWGLAAAILAVYVLTRLVHAEILRRSLGALGHRLGRGETFLLTILRTYAGLLIPRAGLGAPGVYLKLRHGVSFAAYGSLLLPLTMLHLLALGATGLVLQTVPWPSHAASAAMPMTMLFAFVAVLAALAVAVAAIGNGSRRLPIGSFGRRLVAAWQRLGRDKLLLAGLVGLHLLTILLRALRLYLAFLAIGARPSAVGVLLASLLADLAFVVSITPNALGLREVAIVYGSRAIGVAEPTALAAALLDRVIVTATVVLLGQVGIWRLLRPAGGQLTASSSQ